MVKAAQVIGESQARGRAIADNVLRPFAVADDKNAYFRRESIDAIAASGITGWAVPKKYGGGGGSWLEYYAAMEEIGRASLATMITVGVTNLVQGALLAFGTDAQKSEFLPKLVSGELLGAFSLSEPQSGSDAAALRLSAKFNAGNYTLRGNKVWCSAGGKADIYLVMGRTGEHRTRGITSFLVSANTPGFTVGKQEVKLGLRSSPLAELVFDDAQIPEDRRIGSEGEGFAVALSQLDGGRITIAYCGLAAAEEALERTWRELRRQEERNAVPFPEFAKTTLAELWAETQAVRSLLQHAAQAKDRGDDISTLASQGKLLGSDLAMRVANECLVLLGPEGLDPQLGVERIFRDAKALQIVEGTNQIQKLVIARALEERYSE